MNKIMMIASSMAVTLISFSQEIKNSDRKVEDFASEVYKDCMKYTSSEYLQTYSEWISRVEIREEKRTENESYALFSEVHLKNKCNPSLQRDEFNFNKETFNPLKYRLDYETKTELIYRVNNTNYLVIVHPRQ